MPKKDALEVAANRLFQLRSVVDPIGDEEYLIKEIVNALDKAGWQLVPKTVTDEMVKPSDRLFGNETLWRNVFKEIWEKALNAAPKLFDSE